MPAYMDEPLSLGDKIFGTIAAFSALYCFAVSFVLSLPQARERFLIALAIFLVSFSFVKYKKAVALAILAFIALRFAWAGIVMLLRH
jgi:hypothetical protein